MVKCGCAAVIMLSDVCAGVNITCTLALTGALAGHAFRGGARACSEGRVAASSSVLHLIEERLEHLASSGDSALSSGCSVLSLNGEF